MCLLGLSSRPSLSVCGHPSSVPKVVLVPEQWWMTDAMVMDLTGGKRLNISGKEGQEREYNYENLSAGNALGKNIILQLKMDSRETFQFRNSQPFQKGFHKVC